MIIYNKDEKTGELYHYGIKGQKWGVRRYQNEDGSYTSEGLKRRIKNLTEKAKKEDLLDERSKDEKRLNKAADTGLEALARMGRHTRATNEREHQWDREWFIWEDQTIGFATIADLANRGKTSKEIKNLITEFKDIHLPDIPDDVPGMFQLNEYGRNFGVSESLDKYLNDYIDETVKVANKKK